MFRPLSQTKFINDANLVSYWKLDGNSNDSKGSNNGTDTSMTYSAGKFDSAGVFNGSTSKISVATNTNLGITTSITLSLWLYLSAASGAYSTIILKGTESGANRINYAIDLGSTGKKPSFIYYNSGTALFYRLTGSDLTTGQWNHILLSFTYGTGSSAKIYVNGIDTGATWDGGSINVAGQTNTDALSIGARIPSGDRFLTGTLDDTAIFSRALSAGEVAELYQSMTLGEYMGAGSATTKLLLHLNGSSADSSGNSNNGTDTAITYSQANGKFGQGAGFNGSSSKIDTATSATLAFGTGNNTISLWLKSTLTTNELVIRRDLESASPRRFYQMSLNGNTTGKVDFLFYDNGGQDLIISNTTVNDGNWHMVTMVRGTSIFLYVDGKLDNTATNNSRNTDGVGAIFGLGHRAGYTATDGNFFNGNMDEIIVEPGIAWSAEKVKKMYTYQKGRFGL